MSLCGRFRIQAGTGVRSGLGRQCRQPPRISLGVSHRMFLPRPSTKHEYLSGWAPRVLGQWPTAILSSVSRDCHHEPRAMPMPHSTPFRCILRVMAVAYYVVQNRIDKRYVAGGAGGEPFRMVESIDNAFRCDNEAMAEQVVQNYRTHCRREGHRTIPGKDTLAVVPVEQRPLGKTWWERL